MVGFAETVVGSALISACFSAFFSVLLDRLASTQFLDYCRKEDVDDDLLRRLRHAMMAVHVVLNDAEEMQFTDPIVKQWIDGLKDVIYNAEDLVDEIAYLGLAGSLTRRKKNSTENFKHRFENMILKAENLCRELHFLANDTAAYPNLQILKIRSSCDSLTNFKLKSFNKLEYLLIEDCKNLEIIEVPANANWNLHFIADLEIHDCPKLNLISEAGLPAPNLRTFLISNCNNLESMPREMYRLLTSLQELSILCCPKLQSFPDGGLPSNLQSLLIEKCDLLTPQQAWGLNNMVSLTSLKIIGGSKNLKLFPEEGLLPASLTYLQISEFPELETLNLNGLQLNSSLEKMEINTCPSLRSMSAGSLPSTLTSLEITGCSLLTERCQVGGEDWPKICDIQNKVINGEVV
ncbi:hypothetical protein Q3G72_005089 [Acer saccharum]|nr:hypothetical protein Q3G72_005089 [Acer saccharum]